MLSPFLSRVKVSVPDSWADFSVITLVGPSRPGFRANVVISSEELKEPVVAYAAKQLQAMKADAPSLKVVREGPATVAGRPGFALEVTYKSADGGVLRQAQYVAEHGGRAYTLACTHDDTEFEAMRSQFDEIAAGFAVG